MLVLKKLEVPPRGMGARIFCKAGNNQSNQREYSSVNIRVSGIMAQMTEALGLILHDYMARIVAVTTNFIRVNIVRLLVWLECNPKRRQPNKNGYRHYRPAAQIGQ